MKQSPRLLVFSSLFPSAVQPNAGLFVRERVFRLGKHFPIAIVAPQAWFPGQTLIRWFRPHFRPMAPAHEIMDGVTVRRPRFFCVPGVIKAADGWFMALSSFLAVRKMAREHGANVIDAHFGYPDGRAAVLLGKWLKLPVVVTLRGKEQGQSRSNVATALRRAITGAHRVIAVSAALQALAIEQGANAAQVEVIGNGVDLTRFVAIPRSEARRELGLSLGADAEVLISVGTLVERKGFHRVIECLPQLCTTHPTLHLLVVGGAGPEGDIGRRLKTMVRALGLDDRVHFLGPVSSDRLKVALSAADVFVLATSYEGWANVFLEAMACGLPVVATDVGGNAQVVRDESLGRIVPFGDSVRLRVAIDEALRTSWDRAAIRAYAESNSWDLRVQSLLETYRGLLSSLRENSPARAGIRNAR
ncbi:MAG: glycosyltransferase [Burkholderiaceae bacterium]